jgi:hypothetical protein
MDWTLYTALPNFCVSFGEIQRFNTIQSMSFAFQNNEHIFSDPPVIVLRLHSAVVISQMGWRWTFLPSLRSFGSFISLFDHTEPKSLHYVDPDMFAVPGPAVLPSRCRVVLPSVPLTRTTSFKAGTAKEEHLFFVLRRLRVDKCKGNNIRLEAVTAVRETIDDFEFCLFRK